MPGNGLGNLLGKVLVAVAGGREAEGVMHRACGKVSWTREVASEAKTAGGATGGASGKVTTPGLRQREEEAVMSVARSVESPDEPCGATWERAPDRGLGEPAWSRQNACFRSIW